MRPGLERLPVPPSQRTMIFMGKAAVAIHVAVFEERMSSLENPDEQRHEP